MPAADPYRMPCARCGEPMVWGPTPIAGPFPQYGRWRHEVDPDDDHDVEMPAGWGEE